MAENLKSTTVPESLRRWFVVHFAVDMLFALPMMIAPVWLLGLFGWKEIDPFMTRLAAAALLGIGVESLLGRKAGAESYSSLLTLKIIWSLGAVVGAVWTLAQYPESPGMLWAVLAVFLGFNLVWVYWYRQLGKFGTINRPQMDTDKH